MSGDRLWGRAVGKSVGATLQLKARVAQVEDHTVPQVTDQLAQDTVEYMAHGLILQWQADVTDGEWLARCATAFGQAVNSTLICRADSSGW